jgi:hypothetical protein
MTCYDDVRVLKVRIKMKFLAKIAAITGLFIAIIIVCLTFFDDFRYVTFRLAAEIPTIATKISIRGPLLDQNFQAAATGLDRQLSLIQMIGVKRSVMLPGLVENVEFVFDRARLESEFALLAPFLSRLVQSQPDLYLARIWLARSLASTEPEMALSHLNHAIQLVPADERGYRIALDIAQSLQNAKMVKDLCQRYRRAQFGGPHPFRYRNTFWGTGLRKIAVEFLGNDGRSVLVSNEGLQLEEKRVYDFLLPERIQFNSIKLHLGTLPGLKMKLHQMALHTGAGLIKLAPRQLSMSTRYGYFMQPDTIISNAHDGEVITFRSRGKPIDNVDRIDLQMTFERLPLNNLSICYRAPLE